MKNLKSFFKFQVIILILILFPIQSYPLWKINKKWHHVFANSNHTQSRPKKLSNEICNIKNCLVCENRNECIRCKDGFELNKKRCYSTNCHIYGFCKFCDEYDCLKCIKGYKLNYGICDQKEVSRKKLYFIIFCNISLIILIVYICIRYNQIARIRITTGQVIRFIHPKSGFYQLNFEENKVNNLETADENSNNKIGFGNLEPMNDRNESPVVNCCVICKNKNIYAIADCGCSICLLHYKNIKTNKNIKCKVHNCYITSNISFKKAQKSKIRGNAVEKLGLKKCPICKINNGTQSFNCGCPMKVCEKCFNDNIYVFKYNQCPGCGKKYNPIKMTVRWNKSGTEINSFLKSKEENGGIVSDKV